MGDGDLQRIFREAETAGRRGWEFYGWWLDSVCRRRSRQRFIRGDVFDQAKLAWERGCACRDHYAGGFQPQRPAGVPDVPPEQPQARARANPGAGG